jgi:drug/metabolite transporter (DMT)-like permease
MLALAIVVNQVMNVGAATFFALSGSTDSIRRFVIYQIVGGLLGLGINLSYAAMVRFASVQTAAAIGIGSSFVMVQIFSSYLMLRAGFTPWQWVGVSLVFVGIVMIAFSRT